MKTHSPVLRITHLTVKRDRCRILSDVGWTVLPGQHWALIGANGSGKTSLLRTITGYLMPSEGAIELLGHTYGESDWRELRMRVGIVSSAVGQMMHEDEPALDTVCSGRTAMIGLWRRPAPADVAAGRALLRQMGCGRLAGRAWGVLSQGERQRVLIARALMARPALLILDEPCAGLDPLAREHFLQFLNRLGRRRTCPTLILVTHHVEEIMPVFGHVLVLKRGRILTAGPKAASLTSAIMSDAFGGRLGLRMHGPGRRSLRIAPSRKGIL